MVKVPERIQTRRIYALAAAMMTLPWSLLLAGGLPFLGWTPIWYLPLVAAFMAALLWPEYERRGRLLAISATVTTMTVLLFAGFLVGVAFVLPLIRGETDDTVTLPLLLWFLLSTPFAALIFGSLVTLGLPYASAIGVALLFRDDHD